MNVLLTRRAFIERAAMCASALPAVPRMWRGLPVPSATVLRLGLLDGADANRIDGALLGLEEAQHAARLFGGEVRLTKISESGASGHSAIIGDDDAERCARLARAALVMNVSCTADALRGERCAPMLFHVAPSDTMLADAARIANNDGSATAWDASLARFGADTLNQRFHARFGRPMSPAAWASWMAVKILWEASLRAKSADSAAIAGHLIRETTQYDGHKGRPLSFRVWDRQLRQPLYVRRGDKVIEVPADAAPDESPRESLDRLGVPASHSACRTQP
jgi:hypothetical protein